MLMNNGAPSRKPNTRRCLPPVLLYPGALVQKDGEKRQYHGKGRLSSFRFPLRLLWQIAIFATGMSRSVFLLLLRAEEGRGATLLPFITLSPLCHLFHGTLNRRMRVHLPSERWGWVGVGESEERRDEEKKRNALLPRSCAFSIFFFFRCCCGSVS